MYLCPCCSQPLDPASYGCTTWADGEGATLDCGFCRLMLIVHEGVPVDFHRHLNSKNPAWSADGKGTGFIEIDIGE